jgi:hypothetical protein
MVQRIAARQETRDEHKPASPSPPVSRPRYLAGHDEEPHARRRPWYLNAAAQLGSPGEAQNRRLWAQSPRLVVPSRLARRVTWQQVVVCRSTRRPRTGRTSAPDGGQAGAAPQAHPTRRKATVSSSSRLLFANGRSWICLGFEPRGGLARPRRAARRPTRDGRGMREGSPGDHGRSWPAANDGRRRGFP